MGSGASFDTLSSSEEQFFCHNCHRVFNRSYGNVSDDSPSCPRCQSPFVEAISSDNESHRDIARRHGQLTLDQARRIASATAMLRLLETQLREELETLQLAFEAASGNPLTRNKGLKLTQAMKCRLRNSVLDLDVLCSQPSCPVCSEEFSVGVTVLKLPCTHVFHRECVFPWLEQRQNCPICRAELSGEVPSLTEIEMLEIDEIDERLRGMNVEVLDAKSKEKNVLAALLHKHMCESAEKDNRELLLDSENHYHSHPILNVTFRTFTPLIRNGVSFVSYPLDSRVEQLPDDTDAVLNNHEEMERID
jgi:Zn finger protein HypA/HybF involved in hydrogenase expression